VVALRCTQRLLKRLKVKPGATEGHVATNRLGDWYANLVYTPAGQFVVLVSEKTFLPVVVSAKDGATLWPRFLVALRQTLQGLRIPENDIAAELAAMEPMSVAKTASRQVVGVLNEFCFELDWMLRHGHPLDEVARQLPETPTSPLYKTHICPDNAARAAFGRVELKVLR
jgi:hypothetical protein